MGGEKKFLKILFFKEYVIRGKKIKYVESNA